MKKILLAVLPVLMLASCGGNGQENSGKEITAEQAFEIASKITAQSLPETAREVTIKNDNLARITYDEQVLDVNAHYDYLLQENPNGELYQMLEMNVKDQDIGVWYRSHVYVVKDDTNEEITYSNNFSQESGGSAVKSISKTNTENYENESKEMLNAPLRYAAVEYSFYIDASCLEIVSGMQAEVQSMNSLGVTAKVNYYSSSESDLTIKVSYNLNSASSQELGPNSIDSAKSEIVFKDSHLTKYNVETAFKDKRKYNLQIKINYASHYNIELPENARPRS